VFHAQQHQHGTFSRDVFHICGCIRCACLWLGRTYASTTIKTLRASYAQTRHPIHTNGAALPIRYFGAACWLLWAMRCLCKPHTISHDASLVYFVAHTHICTHTQLVRYIAYLCKPSYIPHNVLCDVHEQGAIPQKRLGAGTFLQHLKHSKLMKWNVFDANYTTGAQVQVLPCDEKNWWMELLLPWDSKATTQTKKESL